MSKYKSTTAALLLCTAVSLQAQASDELDKIQREVGIMEKILTAA